MLRWPGTSNHGLAVAVDLMSTAQRQTIDRIGARFGWSKSWSDASWEWWHIRYQPGHFKPRRDPLKHLPKHMERAARLLLYRRRRRKEEGRTGHGPRWRRWNRAVERSFKKVRALHRRADNPKHKHVLARVLADRDGNL